jgi:hypothetical protein
VDWLKLRLRAAGGAGITPADPRVSLGFPGRPAPARPNFITPEGLPMLLPPRLCRNARSLAAIGLLSGGVGASVALAQSPATPAPAAANTAEDYNRPVAHINGTEPITRRELGEFLMARGGADKLELLINKIIIENEAKRLGISVTEVEMEAAFLSDLEGLGEGGVKKGDFVNIVLPKYNKSLYEWMEDVIRPRLLMTKMVAGGIVVSDDEVQKQFEREYGEKRRVQIIMWPTGDDQKSILATYEKIRTNQDEFDRAALKMANPSLAAAKGYIKPICRHTPSDDDRIEKTAFRLNPGEISEIMQTAQGYVVLKMHEVIPPDTKIDRNAVKARLEKQAFDEKLSAAIPAQFKKLKEKAAPTVLYTGPVAWAWNGETKAAMNQLINDAKVKPAGGTAPAPMPSAPAGKVPTPGSK